MSRQAWQAGFLKAQYGERMRNKTQELVKIKDRGPTPLQGEGVETESKPSLLYFQLWRKEYVGS